MSEERGPWYLLTGLLIGVALGLFFALRVRPVTYTNISPASLRSDFKDQYRTMIALAYLSNGDLVRAKARLELLQDGDVFKTLSEQAQRMLAEGNSGTEARALGLLAVELGQVPAPASRTTQASLPLLPGTTTPTAAPPTETAAVLTETAVIETVLTAPATTAAAVAGAVPQTPAIADSVSIDVTPTLPLGAANTGGASAQQPAATGPAAASTKPTGTPLPAQGINYVLQSRDQICDQPQDGPLIQVQVLDTDGEQVPGVEVTVTWAAGEDRFFTGLKPELGPGVADFEMEPGVVYTLILAEGGQMVTNLVAEECETSAGERYWGSWKLVFVQS